MMDVTRFLREGAKYMATDRPDKWTTEQAFERLSAMFAYLAGQDRSGEVRLGGFALQKFIGEGEDEGITEYHLHRQVLSFEILEDEFETTVTNWTNDSTLSNIGLDIPDTIDNDD